jgi:hypothetical protein
MNVAVTLFNQSSPKQILAICQSPSMEAKFSKRFMIDDCTRMMAKNSPKERFIQSTTIAQQPFWIGKSNKEVVIRFDQTIQIRRPDWKRLQ